MKTNAELLNCNINAFAMFFVVICLSAYNTVLKLLFCSLEANSIGLLDKYRYLSIKSSFYGR